MLIFVRDENANAGLARPVPCSESVRRRGSAGRRGASENEVWRPSSSDGKDMFVRVMCSTAVQVLIADARWYVADGTICIGPIDERIRGE